MRMPIFTYFLVVGSVLTGLLVWFGENREFEGAPMKTSQTIGVPKPSMPFKSKPELQGGINSGSDQRQFRGRARTSGG